MIQRLAWTTAALLTGGLIFLLAGPIGQAPASTWLYGAAYFVFGVLLLGAVARWWKRGSPVLWRPAMLSIGALCAAIEVSSRGQSAPVDRWMVALLGLLVAAIVARFMTFRVARFWFGLDRRAH